MERNRVEQDMQEWQASEQKMQNLFSADFLYQKDFQQEKLRHYDKISAKYSKDASPDERQTLRLLQKAIQRLEEKLYPNWIMRTIRRIRAALVDKPRYEQEHQQRQTGNMALQEQLRGMGFPKSAVDLGQYLDGSNQIQVPVKLPGAQQMDYTLNLDKQSSGQYEFNSYQATLKADNAEQNKSHVFRNEGLVTIRPEEEANLLQGRAIARMVPNGYGNLQYEWQTLDLSAKQQDGSYPVKHHGGFDVDKLLKDLNIPETKSVAHRALLIERLAKGEQVELSASVNGKIQPFLIEVNPAAKMLNGVPKALQPKRQEKAKVIPLKAEINQDKGNRIHR